MAGGGGGAPPPPDALQAAAATAAAEMGLNPQAVAAGTNYLNALIPQPV